MASGYLLHPQPIQPGLSVVDLVDKFCLAYNAARLRESCQLMAQEISKPNVTVGLTLSGALTPTGLGYAAIVPLIEAGYVDWIVSTGANLYHDMHRTLGFSLFQNSPFVDDEKLFAEKTIRIYDIQMEQQVLYKTDAFLYQCLKQPEFQKRMGSAELHYLLGRYTLERERLLQTPYRSVLSAAHLAGVPVYTPSPGDSTIGLNIAALHVAEESQVGFNPELDVNETAAIVYRSKQGDGKSAVIIMGGGSPKNFALQTEPQLQEILGLDEKGHDFFIQFTDARPDTGGLSGATPQEAVTWGKVDPTQLPNTVVCYVDSTIALPIFTAYTIDQAQPRALKRLYDQRETMLNELYAVYREKWARVQTNFS